MLKRLFKPLFPAHYRMERHTMVLSIGIIAAASIGGIVEIAPLFTIDETVQDAPTMRLYTPLEQAGRDIYMREGCYACHSQMIRTLRDEVERYGPYSLAVESQYDHPMLWGSKRTGPDLARIGGKYSDEWHAAHLLNPRAVSPQSNMPAYPWLASTRLDTRNFSDRLRALRSVGVPYSDEMIENAARDASGQAMPDSDAALALVERYGEATTISSFDNVPRELTELDAVIAYLQILGGLVDPVELMAEDVELSGGSGAASQEATE